ncbi:phosphate ABC transporter substrate-binding protein PstS [Glaciihabitans sp. dw_435]|uniref:phosphate ABC transporter substrate-binding protein PstS n=1 Tax=Glaciihabitans sp. dw_435 TaxID=2720081 RepID=UPI001BD33741|nr:phosphate ABC transporter substrate-binding protein PstS [Glaciihabitans sp. dw_435]
MTRARRRLLPAILALAITALVIVPTTSAAAVDYVPISGAGSSWSSNAIDQWRRNVQQYGMRINYANTGSSDGRNQYKAGTVDFAVSEIPYGIKDGGVVDTPPSRAYSYIPIVAGGTAFMYNLQAGGKQITNLRLSGSVITKIFTAKITSWDDPAIAADNPGLALPKRKIVPIVRSDGSGSTAQFTTWMSKQYQADWDAYCVRAGRSAPCGVTSNYPTIPGTGFIAQPNSQGVSGYVAQKANIGTITYVEYSYALKTGYPVAKVLNSAGYYVEPTASNVAVGLLGAKINTTATSSSYLTQILDGVYANPDKRTYPLSSYSYMIIPTSTQNNFTEDKGKTLGAFASYFLCEGQQQAEVLGYSPLPINLVKAGLEQIAKIPGVGTSTVNIAKCNNPTFSKDGTNTLAAKAPQPSECDKKGATQCTDGTGGSKTDTPVTTPAVTPGTSTGGTTTGGTTTGGTTTTGGATASDGSSAVNPGTPDAATGGTSTGTVGTATGGTTTGLTAGPVSCEADTGVCANVVALPVEVAATSSWGVPQSLMTGAVVLLIGLVVVPPLIAQLTSRRRRRG